MIPRKSHINAKPIEGSIQAILYKSGIKINIFLVYIYPRIALYCYPPLQMILVVLEATLRHLEKCKSSCNDGTYILTAAALASVKSSLKLTGAYWKDKSN